MIEPEAPAAKPRDWREWGLLVIMALATAALLLGPFLAIREVRDETARVIEAIERDANEARTDAIRINVVTIDCARRFVDIERGAFFECVSSGLDELETLVTIPDRP